MKTLNNIRNILYCVILFGAFANFAQNGYGLSIMGYSEFFVALIFMTEAFVKCRKNWKVSKFRALYLLAEHFLIGLIFMGGFFKNMHYPGASPMLVFSSLFLLIFYFTYGIRVLIKDFKNGKALSIIIFLFFITCMSALAGYTFKTQHFPGGNLLNFIAVICIIVFVLPVAFKIKFAYKEQTITLRERIRNLQGKPSVVLVYFGIWCLYFRLVGFGLAPVFYTLGTPPVLNKYFQQNDSRADIYNSNCSKFFDNRWSAGDLP